MKSEEARRHLAPRVAERSTDRGQAPRTPDASEPRARSSRCRGRAPAGSSRSAVAGAAERRADLSVDLGRGLVLANPILVASGTFGYGIEYGDVVDVQRIGGDLLQGHDVEAADRQPAAARDRDAGRDAQLDRAPEPGRGRGHREVRAALAGVADQGPRQRLRRVDRRLRGGRAAARRRAGRGRDRAQHLVPERGQGRDPVRDRCVGGRRGHRRGPPRDRPAAAGEAVAERRRRPARSRRPSRRAAPTRSRP